MKQLLTLLIIIAALTSCDTVTVSNSRLLSLYRQRIPDSKYVIYAFDITGHMAFDGDNQGLAILDSNQIFSKDRIDEIDAYYIQGKLRADSLHMVDLYSPGDRTTLESDTLMTPTKCYVKNYNGIPIRVSEYLSTYGTPLNWTSGGNDYVFDSLRETKDSLFFSGIRKKDGYGINLPLIKGFIKGNITLVDSSNEERNHIEIKELIIKRGEVYKDAGRNIILKNRPIVDMVSYNFFPKTPTYNISLSNIGIYKRIK